MVATNTMMKLMTENRYEFINTKTCNTDAQRWGYHGRSEPEQLVCQKAAGALFMALGGFQLMIFVQLVEFPRME